MAPGRTSCQGDDLQRLRVHARPINDRRSMCGRTHTHTVAHIRTNMHTSVSWCTPLDLAKKKDDTQAYGPKPSSLSLHVPDSSLNPRSTESSHRLKKKKRERIYWVFPGIPCERRWDAGGLYGAAEGNAGCNGRSSRANVGLLRRQRHFAKCDRNIARSSTVEAPETTRRVLFCSGVIVTGLETRLL